MTKKKLSKAVSDAPQEAGPDFEEALGQLEGIVRRLEQGGGSLDNALDDYASAVGLLKTCQNRLEQAERRIEILSGVDAQGNPITEELVDEESSLEDKQQSRSRRRTAAGAARTSPNEDEKGGLF
jgi:exodeoxyribonuclease VII small subunit